MRQHKDLSNVSYSIYEKASKLHISLCCTGSTDPRSPCYRERPTCSVVENHGGASTCPQQATKPDSAEPAVLVSPSDGPAVALNATDSRGLRHYRVLKAAEGQNV